MAYRKIEYVSAFGDTPQEIIEAAYNPFITLDDIKREYTRYRGTLKTRLRRLDANGYDDTNTAQRIRKLIENTPSSVRDRKSAALLLSEAIELLNWQTSTVSGMQLWEENTLIAVQKHGYQIDNVKQLRAFVKFMNKMRDLNVIGAYDSRVIASAFTSRGRRARNGVNSEKAWKIAVGKRLGLSWDEVLEIAGSTGEE